MKNSVTAKLTLGAAVVIIALVVSMVLSLEARNNQTQSRYLVLHTYKVLNALERINSVMKDAETGQRGFILTGDISYLEPHSRASASIDKLIDELKNLISDNAEQQHRLGILSVKTDEILLAQQKTIELRKLQGLRAAADARHFIDSTRKMVEIHKTIEDMIETENKLLAERSVNLNSNTAKAFAFATWFSVLSIVCVIVANWLLLRFLKARQRAEQELSTQYAVARILNESRDLKDAARRVEQLIGEAGDWCIGATWIVDRDEKVLKCLDLWRLASLADSKFIHHSESRTFESGIGLPGRVWASGQASSIIDVTSDANFPRRDHAREIGLTTAFAFPIKFGAEVLAVTEFFATDRRHVDKASLNMMTAIGNQLGQYIIRKNVEVETEKQRQFLELILDTVSDGIMVADANAKFILSNSAARSISGNAEEADPKDWSEHFGVFVEEDGEKFPNDRLPLIRAINGEEVNGTEMFIRNSHVPEGKWLSVSGRPLKEDGDSVTGGVIFFRDVSDKKEAEKRVSEFYSTVSHELRTPLTSIRGSLGLIEGGLSGELPEKTMRLIKIARAESDRLIRLINDILDLRKIEAGMLELKKTTVDTQTIVQRTIESIRGMAEERGVTLVEKLNTSGPTQCDEDRIIQVLTNLISNAIKFSDRGDKVVISLDPGEGSTFKFSVTDSGPGIAQEQMHKLFGKFQQLDQSDSRKKEGTGLGLAITQAIVKEHDGKIGVDSKPGEGSTFWVELPAVFSPLRRNDKSALPASHVHPALIVEDDESLAQVLRVHLETDGFEVVHAKSLKEADALLNQYKPLVILLDLGLPDGSGLELMKRLSVDEKRRDVPVVVISGTEQDGKATYTPALIDWIAKPFSEMRLHKALDVARSRIGIPQVLIVEDDPSTREILKQQIESLGVKCLEASNGADALSRFGASNPDLIILDLMIPPPDGFAVIEKLQGQANNIVPLVVYSALDLTEAEKSRLKLGITAHLTKSTATPDQLSNVIREFLNGWLLRKTDGESAGSSDNSYGE